ncbi:hypothetical protein [Aminipila sp.]|uniref:hypothetical protein n=1 Tax=Aminipila sp. TaxID=2060095 RepID=UPI00289F5566|nr:hypothetical protein [Aminipila sp.]
MKKQTAKILMCAALVLVLAFAMTTTVFAGYNDTDQVSMRTANTIVKSFTATNSKKATASVQASCSGTTPYVTSKITLQSAPLGSSTYSNVSNVSTEKKTVYDRTTITHICYFPITSDKNYRIKIQLTDEVNGVESTVTTYCNLSR